MVGILFGSGINTGRLERVTDDAEHVYRERLLRSGMGCLSASRPRCQSSMPAMTSSTSLRSFDQEIEDEDADPEEPPPLA